jgi:cellobiose phosphorylase
MNPCIPRQWRRFEVAYRHGSTLYRITVENPNGVCRGVSRTSIDGKVIPGEAIIPLADDGREHDVQVVLG